MFLIVTHTEIELPLTSNDEIESILTFNNMAVSREQLKVEEIQYNKLTSLYVLGGYNIDMEISCDGQTKTISNISIAPNYKTNIVGKI